MKCARAMGHWYYYYKSRHRPLRERTCAQSLGKDESGISQISAWKHDKKEPNMKGEVKEANGQRQCRGLGSVRLLPIAKLKSFEGLGNCLK